MNLAVRDDVSSSEWQRLVDRTETSTAFHQTEWLNAAAAASKLEGIRVIVESDGEALVGLPLFMKQVGPVRGVLSPPPALGIEYLGPLIVRATIGTASDERKYLLVLQKLLAWIDERFRPSIVYFRMVPGISDARPLRWNGYVVEPLYTYVVDVPRTPEIGLQSLDRSLRSDITRTANRVSVRAGGAELLASIRAFVAAAHKAHGSRLLLPQSYLDELYAKLGPGSFQPIGAYTPAGLEAAAVVLFRGDRAIYWQGAVGPHHSQLPLTSHLVWSSILLARERGYQQLEIAGANTPRLVEFKSKFRPRLESYFQASKATVGGRVALLALRRFRRR